MKNLLTLAAFAAASLAGFGATMLSTGASAGAATVFIPGPPRIIAYDGQWEGRNDVQGRVENFNGRFGLELHVAGQGFLPVHLHQGTVINPRGTTLQRGMLVNVHGFFANGRFQADVINLR